MKRVVFIVLVAAFFWSCATTPDVMDDEGFLELLKTGSLKEVNKAIRKGADITFIGEDGITPLMCAAGYNENPEVVQLLIDSGADVNARDKTDNTPLMYAAQYNKNPVIIEQVIDAGGDLYAIQELGHTVFFYVEYNEACLILISTGRCIDCTGNHFEI
jgi:ankyrin repeat protein